MHLVVREIMLFTVGEFLRIYECQAALSLHRRASQRRARRMAGEIMLEGGNTP